MKTYWEHAQEEYPIGSKWKCKTTGEIYEVTELTDFGLLVGIKLENKNYIHGIPSCNMHLEYTRLQT